MEAGDMPELLRPIAWIIGKWVSKEGSGKYPTIKDFRYNETLEFRRCGMQPLVSYSGSSSHIEKGNPMHLENGFLRSRGNGQVSFMVAHNFGLTTLEEGEINGKEMQLKSQSISRMTGAKDPSVTEIDRVFTLTDENTLVQKLSMRTSTTTVMTEHLVVTYTRE
ncbi:unnamed protein product [Orchesella dallaii]|uniref:THAP4-like heme-binding domain-containing protein n=1 Tax=Orchesella dallaii TaxID=48710 RepID=A0ABP1QVI1_9HEXA